MNCKLCGAPMRHNKGKYGDFWGCTRFRQGCKWTEPYYDPSSKQPDNWSRLRPNIAQQEALRLVKDTNRNVAVRSTAGSGKSTLIRMVIRDLLAQGYKQSDLLVLMFGNDAAKDMSLSCAANGWSDVWVSTFHRFGLDLHSITRGRQTKKYLNKTGYWLEKLYATPPANMRSDVRSLDEAYLEILTNSIVALHDAVRYLEPGHINNPGILDFLLQRFESVALPVSTDPKATATMQLLVLPLLQGAHANTVEVDYGMDFADMVYLPVYYGHTIPHKVIIVDEAQDVSQIQHHFMRLAPNARFIVVGDPWQSIYEWRGAWADIMDILADEFNMGTVSINLSYRNPLEVVRYINGMLPFIDHDTALTTTGQVLHLDTDSVIARLLAADDAMLLAPRNYPLFKVATRLMAQGIPVQLKDTALMDVVLGVLSATGLPAGTPAATVLQAVDYVIDERVHDAITRGSTGQFWLDVQSCIRAVTGELPTAKAIKDHVKALRYSNTGLKLSTIHGAKGLEAEHIGIIDRKVMSHEQGTEAARAAFVAYSRSKGTLLLGD